MNAGLWQACYVNQRGRHPKNSSDKLLNRLRTSAVPYVGSLILTVMAAGWGNYLSPLIWPEGFTIRGQALAIVIPIILFPVSLLLWLIYNGKRVESPWATAFLIGLAISWVVHMLIIRYHGDQYPHVVWLFIPILIMFFLKAPSPEECWTGIMIFGWAAAVIIVLTRALEMASSIPVFRIDPAIIEWEKERYWLPVSDLLGINGRWPGPFGYNSKTGFIGALLVLIAVARWSRSSWFLLPIGSLVVLATASRGSFLALSAGVAVLVVFATRGPLSRIPISIRTAAFSIIVVLVGLTFLRNPTGTTGRSGPDGIWSNFLDLWRTSPWLGVGQVGILADPDAGISMEAHNLFIQHLTRFGSLGLVIQYIVIGLAIILMIVAAYRGLSWPLVIASTYYVASLTEVFQDGWMQHTIYSLLLVLSTIAGAAYVKSGHNRFRNHVSVSSANRRHESFEQAKNETQCRGVS